MVELTKTLPGAGIRGPRRHVWPPPPPARRSGASVVRPNRRRLAGGGSFPLGHTLRLFRSRPEPEVSSLEGRRNLARGHLKPTGAQEPGLGEATGGPRPLQHYAEGHQKPKYAGASSQPRGHKCSPWPAYPRTSDPSQGGRRDYGRSNLRPSLAQKSGIGGVMGPNRPRQNDDGGCRKSAVTRADSWRRGQTFKPCPCGHRP